MLINGACGIFKEVRTDLSAYWFFMIDGLKEFHDRDRDEDRARSWIIKIKSEFLTYQITDEVKCLLFDDLRTVPAHNRHS